MDLKAKGPVLLINGSPRKERSNTLKLAAALLAGYEEATGAVAETLTVYDMDIAPCRGCFACWRQTPGRCALRDDMDRAHALAAAAKLIVVSFPLYFYGAPSQMKAFLDRMLPVLQIYNGGPVLKRTCYSFGDKHFVVVSSCGYRDSGEVYDPLRSQMKALFGDRVPADLIAVPQGEMIREEQMGPILEKRLEELRDAGRRLARTGSLTQEELAALSRPFMSPRAFERIVGAGAGAYDTP